MKLRRGVSGDHLIRTLVRLGYEVIRQKGSHMRLRHEGPPPHVITIPMHNPLKTGTLHGILVEVARMRSKTVESIAQLLLSQTGLTLEWFGQRFWVPDYRTSHALRF